MIKGACVGAIIWIKGRRLIDERKVDVLVLSEKKLKGRGEFRFRENERY